MKTLEGAGIILLIFLLTWFVFGDDDLAIVLRWVIGPIIILLLIFIGGGYLIGHYIL
jgi:hypothetical protein